MNLTHDSSKVTEISADSELRVGPVADPALKVRAVAAPLMLSSAAGEFVCDFGCVRWHVFNGLFWVLGLACGGHPRAAAALLRAVRSEARSRGFTQMFWQIHPDESTAMTKAIGKRARVDYIQMVSEV